MDNARLYREYLAWWTKALPSLLGWSVEQVTEWAEREKPSDELGYEPLFNAGPAGWIARLLIPKSVRSRLSADEIRELHRAIRLALEREPTPFACYKDPLYDWEEARRRIGDLVSSYDR